MTWPCMARSSTALLARLKPWSTVSSAYSLWEVAVPPDGRARAAVAGALPVVRPLRGPRRQALHALGEPCGGRRQVVQHPVHPGHLRRGRVRRIRVVDDEGEALRPGRHGRPGERRRNVAAVAGVFLRDRAVVRKGARAEIHRSAPSVGRWRYRPRGGPTTLPFSHTSIPRRKVALTRAESSIPSKGV